MRRIGSVILIVLVGLGVYFNSLHGEFQFDDQGFIVENAAIRDLTNPQAIWQFESTPTRFLTFYTFALNYYFHGLDVFGYHLVNVCVHIINAILVWFFVILLFESPRMREEKITRHKEWLALLTALIFLTHPIATQAVAYIAQRFASLATLFYLCSICLYLKGRISKQVWFLAGSALTAGFGMLTKEIVFTLPLMIVALECYFFNAQAIKALKWRFAALILLFLSIVPLLWQFQFDVVLLKIQPSQSHFSDVVSIVTYSLTQPRVLWTYIRLLVFPVGQNLDYDFAVSHSLFEASVFLSLIGLMALVWICFKFYRKNVLLSFGMAWFFITILVESSIIPIRHVIFEHRMYLPSVGFSLVSVMVLYQICQIGAKIPFDRKFIILGSLVVIMFCVLTIQRNKVWQTQIALWEDVVSKSPHKARSHLNLGSAYLRKKKYDSALLSFMKTVELDQLNTIAYSNIGIIYEETGNNALALDYYNKAIDSDAGFPDIFSNRGIVYMNLNQAEKALFDFNKAIEIDPNFYKAYINRGRLYDFQKQYKLAFEDYNRALELNPHQFEAYNNRGVIYKHWKQDELALKDYNQALEYNPESAATYNNRGRLYLGRKNYAAALSDFNKAIELQPDLMQTYNDRGIVFNETKQYVKAIEDFDKAIELGAEMFQVFHNRGNAYDGLKQYDLAFKDYSRALELNPKVAATYFNRAKVLADRKEYAQALADANQAKELGYRRADELIEQLSKMIQVKND